MDKLEAHFWIYFPLKFNEQKSSEIKKLDKHDSRIAEYTMKRDEITIIELFNEFSDYEMEDSLTSVFSLVNKGILLRNQFSLSKLREYIIDMHLFENHYKVEINLS